MPTYRIRRTKTFQANVRIVASSKKNLLAKIGEGTKIWHFCHISAKAEIGENCSLGQNVFVANQVKIGNGVKIQNNVSIYEGVELEDDVFCGPSMVFTNVATPRSHVSRKHEYLQTVVKRGYRLAGA